MSDVSGATEWSGSPTGGQDALTAFAEAVTEADREAEIAALPILDTPEQDEVYAAQQAKARERDFDGAPFSEQRLMSQWVVVNSEYMRSARTQFLTNAVTEAVERLRLNARKEGREITGPVMLRIVAEAFVE